MKTQIIRHGEVILKPVNKLPKEAKLNNEDYKIIGTGSSFYDRLRAKYKAQQRNINKPRKKDMSGSA